MKKLFNEIGLIAAISFPFIILLIFGDFRAPLDFDSAFNLNVVKNFVQNGVYGTSVYLVDGQKYYWFDPWISTGPSVLLPISLFVFLTKSIFIIPRFVMNVIFYLFIYLLSKLISKINKKLDFHRVLGLNIALTVIHTYYFDKILNLSFFIHGEVTGYLYIVTALLSLLSGNPLTVGLFLGLTLLTKMQFIYLCGPLLLGSIYYFRRDIKKVLTLIISFGMPPFLYFIALLVTFGKGIRRYYGDFKGVAIMQHANPTLSQIADIPKQLIQNIQNYPAFFVLAVIAIALVVIKFRKLSSSSKIISSSFVFFLLYFMIIWRSNSPGHLYMPKFISFIWVSYNLIGLFTKANQRCISNGIIVGSILLMPTLLIPRIYLKQQQDTSKYLNKKYPTATFYNIGWWKSPELQIFMKREVIRLDKINLTLCKKDCYLLVSKNQKQLDPNSVKEAKKYKLAENQEYFTLYKIK